MKYVNAFWFTFFFDLRCRVCVLADSPGDDRWPHYWKRYPVEERFKNCLSYIKQAGYRWTWP